MESTIKKYLLEVAESKDLKILMAVESGSRAWGFPSTDSDYDVRIIYIKNKDWYLSINDKKDNIDYFYGELLDINGWDIRKSLRLLKRSNVTPFEWAQSPIVYMEQDGFRERLMTLANKYFLPIHSLNHYKGIAHNSFETLDGNQIKLKKLFYVLRPILAAKWILDTRSLPPMDIFSLMKNLKEDTVKYKIQELIEIKATAKESFVYTIDRDIKNFIEESLRLFSETKLPKEKPIIEDEDLNVFYRSLLKET